MDRRLSVALISIASTAGLLLPALSGSAAAKSPHTTIPSTPVPFCTSSPAPCIESVTRDGGTPVLADDPTWLVSASYSENSGAMDLLWSAEKSGAAVHDPTTGENYSSLGPGEDDQTWAISFDLSDVIIPRVTGTYANNVSVDRTAHHDGTYEVTITGQVTKQAANAECDSSVFPAACPVQSSADIEAFQGEISDFGQWSDASQRPDFYGLDASTNVEATYSPPTVSGDPFVIEAPLANSYKFSNGDVVQGFYRVVIPNHFLQDMGIDDPSTLSPSGVDVSVATASVIVHPGADSTEINATGVTFEPAPTPPSAHTAALPTKKKHPSVRKLKVKRGVITPTKPSHVTAKRAGSHQAKVGFGKAKARGSKVVRYQARCVARGSTVKGTAKHSPIKVNKLSAGTTYKCRVRAKSKAGYGRWSSKDKT